MCDPSLLPACFIMTLISSRGKNWINLCCIICDLYLSIQVNTWAHTENPSPGMLSEAVFLRLSRHSVCLQKNLVMNRAALFKRCYSATGEMERILFFSSFRSRELPFPGAVVISWPVLLKLFSSETLHYYELRKRGCLVKKTCSPIVWHEKKKWKANSVTLLALFREYQMHPGE